MGIGGARLLVTEHLDTRHDAVLTIRKTPNAMITGWAQGARALAALHGRWISGVIRTSH
jgi:hypothetical protein